MRFITILRVLLFPFSVLYGVIVSVRNLLYDFGWLTATKFDLPLITVGNLSVGGTGKTPQIEYLIRLLQNNYSVAVLSRGYKRKSKGFVLGNSESTVLDLGDEPFQYHQKFHKIHVAVDGNRVEGVKQLKVLQPNTDVVLLDDAYQHRKIKAGYQILLSSYDSLFYNDFMMPTGNLRELWWGKNRANSIVITKCPEHLSEKEQTKIIKRVRPAKHQQVYFTKIGYGANVLGFKEIALNQFIENKLVLITGIAKPKPLVAYLESLGATFEHLDFPDHHHFTEEELTTIKEKAKHSKIITTEKDYVRLENEISELYYLPIETCFLNHKSSFDQQILNFVKGL
ncbi:tetraacyldisaccharide 4'-kinase [Wenyingzhuangia aestuarii]|uniref:tetraacyldisaccharide 4'-kinase n=1 Tax=Wenyingzhuangia aestuarii TaxID=1647582 RepID=UPI001ADD526A|nr:tetraacyldisaccharide 4'-kinase [Wenyingzhuangia aestuarii]NJB83277.1 tetraacyldisaccharide 4'-kinase [Wenyingzhuangia aestuarii]